MAIMPGAISLPACFGIKLVCKYEREQGSQLGSHVGMVLLFDSERGIPLAMLEGSSLTAIRTSATSGLATDLLARSDANRLAILGNGEQAMRHIAAMRAVRPITQVSVWGRHLARAQEFAKKAESVFDLPVIAHPGVSEAVTGADIVCTTTAAHQPILAGSLLEPGMHINLVGAAIPSAAEVDREAVSRSRYYVDYRPAAMAAAGELLRAIETGDVTEDCIIAEIGEVVAGVSPARQSAEEITMYKSLGIAAQDLAAAHGLFAAAEREHAGIEVDLLL